MKRVVFLLALAFCVVALTSFNTAAAGPQDRVKICHHNLDDRLEPEWFVIEVARPAVEMHVLNHGDYELGPLSQLQVGQACPAPS